MNKLLKIICLYALLMVSTGIHAQQVNINALRFWTAPERTRMVFDISAKTTHKVFLLDNPARLVIDFKNAKLSKALTHPPKNNLLIKSIRSAAHTKDTLRVVVDLKLNIKQSNFTLNPTYQQSGSRFVVDLYANAPAVVIKKQVIPKKKSVVVAKRTLKKQITPKKKPVVIAKRVLKKQVVPKKKPVVIAKNISKKPKKIATKTVKKRGREIIIAIDAGHGGNDPGATGATGTQEKKVVLQIAKKLSKLINKQPGMKAIMVREGDYYIKLRKRMDIARAAKADLFISIHADAFKSAKVKGATVFTLSSRGASHEASRWLNLTKHENFVGGLSLDDKDDDVASILMDLSQKVTKDMSHDVAKQVLSNLKSVGHLHKSHVQKANFMVLKSPDIPSILIETAFISNPKEEKRLKTRSHQQKMARAIFKGVVNYYKKHAPANSLFALASKKKGNRHVISRGDTLSKIAQKYGVSLNTILVANALSSHSIQVGQVLKIPRG